MSARVRLRRRGGRPGSRFGRHTDDPLSGVANLADVMLVFACGLLVALVLAWDMARALDPALPARMRLMEALRSAREVEQMQRAEGTSEASVTDGLGRYRSLGQVYRDTLSGKMFIVEEEP